jgi:hypothetical protein
MDSAIKVAAPNIVSMPATQTLQNRSKLPVTSSALCCLGPYTESNVYTSLDFRHQTLVAEMLHVRRGVSSPSESSMLFAATQQQSSASENKR